MFSQTCWHFPKIYKLNQKLAPDHKPIGITLNFKSYNKNRIYTDTPQYVTEKIVMKDLTKEQLENLDKAIAESIKIEECHHVLNVSEKLVNL